MNPKSISTRDEVQLTLSATEAGYTRVVPSNAKKLEPGRHALCRPEVFQQGHVVVVLKTGAIVQFKDGQGPSAKAVGRKSIQYYWTDQADSPAQFWARQDAYRFAKYNKVWRIHDKESEENLTAEFKEAKAKAEAAAEANKS